MRGSLCVLRLSEADWQITNPDRLPQQDPITPREQKLYAALTLVLGINTTLLFGALTFFVLALRG